MLGSWGQIPMNRASTKQRKIAKIMMFIVIGLLAHNLLLHVRNQIIFDDLHRVHEQFPRLSQAAKASKNLNTRHKVGIFHFLRDQIRDTRVTLPASLGRISWWLERVARVDVVNTKEKIEISPEQLTKLSANSSSSSFVRIGGHDWPIHFIFAEGEEHYVIAKASGARAMLLLPESVYRSL